MFLVPRDFVRQILLPSARPAAPIRARPRFRAPPSDEQLHTEKGYFLSVDRLSEERGGDELSRARPSALRLLRSRIRWSGDAAESSSLRLTPRSWKRKVPCTDFLVMPFGN